MLISIGKAVLPHGGCQTVDARIDIYEIWPVLSKLSTPFQMEHTDVADGSVLAIFFFE